MERLMVIMLHMVTVFTAKCVSFVTHVTVSAGSSCMFFMVQHDVIVLVDHVAGRVFTMITM